MISFLDYLLCIPFWVGAYYSLRTYWRDKSDVQARYTLLMLFFMAVALTLNSPFLFRAIVRLVDIKNIPRLMADFSASLSIYYYYAMVVEVHPPYRRHLVFIRLHLILVVLILSFCFFKARLGFISFTCFLALIYCGFKFAALMIQRFSNYFPGPFFFVTVKLITIAVGILASLILTMPKLVKHLIILFYYFRNLGSIHSELCGLISMLDNLLFPSRSHQSTQKIYYISALGEKLGLEDESIQLIKEADIIFDVRQGRVNQEQQEALYLRELINSSLATPAISQLDYLKELYFFHNLYQVTRHIGENYDGTGRPSGLARDRIPLGARIIRVVDYYVSRTDMEIDPETVITELQERSGTLFDPKIVQALLEILASGLGGSHTQ